MSQRSFTRKVAVFSAAISCLISACALFELSPEEKALREQARSVQVANAISVTELQAYQELGPVDCERTVYSTSTTTEEDCRFDLKMEAARLGGDLVIVESRDRMTCNYTKEVCVHMHGRVFKRKPPGAGTH